MLGHSKLSASLRSVMALDLTKVQPLFDSESSEDDFELDENEFTSHQFNIGTDIRRNLLTPVGPNAEPTSLLLSKLKVMELKLVHCTVEEEELAAISEKIYEVANVLDSPFILCSSRTHKEKMYVLLSLAVLRLFSINQPAVPKERMTKALWPQMMTDLIPWFRMFFQGRDYLLLFGQTKKGDWLGILKKEERVNSILTSTGLQCKDFWSLWSATRNLVDRYEDKEVRFGRQRCWTRGS